ncbi:hypothetical protein [Paenibacillus radicibacter]|uniref:hypothetical protein n=1 Tax=Paenibacillus radicibacter TaxID=2972488 RepID=UPI0021596DF9|nr:hypothetical protein [Paenibacillus radicibacter]
MRTCRGPRRAANAAVARLVAQNPAIRFPYRIKTAIDTYRLTSPERYNVCHRAC